MKTISPFGAIFLFTLLTTTMATAETSENRIVRSQVYPGSTSEPDKKPDNDQTKTELNKSDTTARTTKSRKIPETMPALKLTGPRTESGSTRPKAQGYQERHQGCYDCSDPDYILANATIVLNDDYDHDGFYPWLKVRFDIDKYGYGQWVFARLFMSYEGGPWNHYATTDDFYVSGFSDYDDYIVETELIEGFPTGYYDIKIELYHADSEGWLVSFGPGDDSSFAAIPLEDEYNDDDYYSYEYGYYNDYIAVSGGGGMGAFLIAIALLGCSRLTRL